MKSAEHFDGERNGFRRQEHGLKNRFSQSRDFAVFEDFNQTVREQARDLQADRVRSDVNGNEGWHSASVYSPVKEDLPGCAVENLGHYAALCAAGSGDAD